jgi:hypothetical protein
MSALYQLAAEYRDAAERMADLDLPAEVIADTLEGLAGDIEAKATNTAQMVRNIETLAEQIKAAEKAMAERRKALEARADWLRSYLLANLIAAGISKVESPWFSLTVRQNPPSVALDDVSLIPTDYWRALPPPPPVIDRAGIREAIEAGQDVPGARVVRGQRLEIK